MNPNGGRRLAPTWLITVQIVSGLVMLVSFSALVVLDGRWFAWMGVAGALLVLGSIGYEIRRRRRGRRW